MDVLTTFAKYFQTKAIHACLMIGILPAQSKKKKVFFGLKDPVPLSKNQGKRNVTTYKITEYCNSCLTVCTSSSGLPTDSFQFIKMRVPDIQSLTWARDDEIGLKSAKARDIAKYVSSTDPQHHPYFEHMLQKYKS